MTTNLETAQQHLALAHQALAAEMELTWELEFAVADALSLVMDAESQVRGAMKQRLPERPILDRGAA
jgi:hypothetical protein